MDMITPIFDFTSKNEDKSFMESFNDITPLQFGGNGSAERRMLNSGKNGTKRSVSETKKKFVASQQNWKCGHCQKQLPAWFEVDHKIRLDNGGSNHVDNLVALCRDCHGRKTAMENL
jgi:5-methylcytosine-specific restriction endonuclease McrA